MFGLRIWVFCAGLLVLTVGQVFAQPWQPHIRRMDWWRNTATLDMDFAHNRYMVSLTTPVVYTSLSQFISAVSGTFSRPGANTTATGDPFYLSANQSFVSRASSATYIDSSGVMRTAAANTARVDYDPVTHAYRGILAEPVRTNMVKNSSGFSETGPSMTVILNYTNAPDGTLNASRVQWSQVASSYVASTITSPSSAATYTYSVFIKPNDIAKDNVVNLIQGGGCSRGVAIYRFNPNNPSLSLGASAANAINDGLEWTGISGGYSAVSNGWYRVYVTGTVSGTSTCNGFKTILSAHTLGTTGDISVWGQQLEIGTSPTSYIPTNGSTVTRAADVYTAPDSGTYFDSTGTLRDAPANTPRLDYNPSTTEARGVLIEEARTNYVPNTDISTWSINSAATKTAGGGAFGANSLIVDDISTTNYGVVSSADLGSLWASTSYTGSIYVKVDPTITNTEPLVRTGLYYGGPGDYYAGCRINPSTGGTVPYGTAVCAATRVGAFWRLSWAFTTSSSAPLASSVQILPRGVTPAPTGLIEVFGPQLERGSFPTSYIPTSGTAVTRAGDYFQIPTSTGWFNANEGTFLADSFANFNSSPGQATVGRIIGADFPKVFISMGASANLDKVCIYTGATSLYTGSFTPSAAPDVSFRSAASFDAATSTQSITARGLAASSNAYTGSWSVDNIYIGSNGYISSSTTLYDAINASVRRVTYFPARQPDDSLPDYTR